MTNLEAKKIIYNQWQAFLDDNIDYAGISEAYKMAMKALEQQPCEDTEVIKVSKGAVKARQGRFVIYDVDWLKKNFYATEEKIYGQPKQLCEDCISRQKALACFEQTNTRQGAKYAIETLPSVTPKYADEEIDKAQAVEQAYVDKMVELAVEEIKRPKGKWRRVVDKAGHWVWECDCKWQQRFATNYCPNCGAEMSGGGEDDD